MAAEVAFVLVREAYGRLEEAVNASPNREVAVLLNNLGSLPQIEMLVLQVSLFICLVLKSVVLYTVGMLFNMECCIRQLALVSFCHIP